MTGIQEKIAAIQVWINEVQLNPATESKLNEILELIYPAENQNLSDEALSETALDLAKRVQEQTSVLSQANSAMKEQIIEHETAEIRLRKAHSDLELRLQDHIGDLSRLNHVLQIQIKEQERNQIIEMEERALTDALRNTLATIGSTLDLGKVLDKILDNLGQVTPYDGANVLLIEADLVRIVRQRGYSNTTVDNTSLKQRIPSAKLAILQQLIEMGKPVAIADTSSSPLWIGFPDFKWVNSNVIAPIRSNGKILGFLSLDSATPGYFTQVHAERLQSFADQAAIAIQNARLLDRAKRAAVLAERNRLANELHDTISQTLWSLILISERLPAIWETNREKGRESLATVHHLAQSALEEMRALLLELRPSALKDEKLGDLIRQVATIIAKRSGLELVVRIEGQQPVPPEVHFVLYRVVQEALNNVAHHALASQIEIYFNSDVDRLELSIQDDGLGFEPDEVGLNHLGLSIMKDRVENIGGSIETISHKGKGTLIKVRWSAASDSYTNS
jgi:signal transduction histidine kinase